MKIWKVVGCTCCIGYTNRYIGLQDCLQFYRGVQKFSAKFFLENFLLAAYYSTNERNVGRQKLLLISGYLSISTPNSEQRLNNSRDQICLQ